MICTRNSFFYFDLPVSNPYTIEYVRIKFFTVCVKTQESSFNDDVSCIRRLNQGLSILTELTQYDVCSITSTEYDAIQIFLCRCVRTHISNLLKNFFSLPLETDLQLKSYSIRAELVLKAYIP